MPPYGLTGRPVVITGASPGLGAALGRAAARAGAPVALCATSPDVLEGVAGEIRADGGEAEWWKVDVSSWSAPEPGEVTGVFLWLLSDASEGVTGRRFRAKEWSPEEAADPSS